MVEYYLDQFLRQQDEAVQDDFEREYCFTCQHWQMVYEIHPTYRFKDQNGVERPAVQAAAARCTKIAPSPCEGRYWEPRREQRIYGEIA